MIDIGEFLIEKITKNDPEFKVAMEKVLEIQRITSKEMGFNVPYEFISDMCKEQLENRAKWKIRGRIQGASNRHLTMIYLASEGLKGKAPELPPHEIEETYSCVSPWRGKEPPNKG